MNAEFHQLAKKIEQIATLVQTLRKENTDLRSQLDELTTTNAELSERIQQAHERVSVMLNNAPFTTEESE
jgi:cell division protein ZapB